MTSLWSSVEVLDLLSRVQSIITIDPSLVRNLKEWVQRNQEYDGSFRPHFIDTNPDNSTKASHVDKVIAATAQALVALINVGIENERDSDVIHKAKTFLEFRIDTPREGCALAMLTYALVSVKSSRVGAALERLKNASTNEEGEFGWPRSHTDNSDWIYEEAHLNEFKASLYVLMAYTFLGDLKSAEPVARYLFYRANILDTHSELIFTAVKAFSEFGSLALDPNRWLTVSLATSGMELTDTLELRANSSPQLLTLPSLPTKVFVYATGAGCATVQGQISYATYSSIKTTSLFDLWSGVTEEILPRRNSIQELEGKLPLLNIKICFKWKGEGVSGVVRVEAHLFSGFELLSVQPSEMDIDYGSRGDRLWFVVSNVSSHCAVCIEFTAKSDYIIGRLRPAFVRVYPSGRPDLAAELFFHTRRGSPLLAETSEDDLITWFGSARAGESDGMSSDFSEICACGQVCVDEATQRATTSEREDRRTDEARQEEAGGEFTDIIVLSELRENGSTTEAELRGLGFNSTADGYTVEASRSPAVTTLSPTTHPTTVPTTKPTTTKPSSTLITNIPTSPPNITTSSPLSTKDPKPKTIQKITKTKIIAKSIIAKSKQQKIKLQPKNSQEKPVEPAQGPIEYKREKHIDIIPLNITQPILSTLLPPEILRQLSHNENHFEIKNLTDSNLDVKDSGKHINKELKAAPLIEIATAEPILPNAEDTAKISRDSGESILTHGRQVPMDILKSRQNEKSQDKSPAG